MCELVTQHLHHRLPGGRIPCHLNGIPDKPCSCRPVGAVRPCGTDALHPDDLHTERMCELIHRRYLFRAPAIKGVPAQSGIRYRHIVLTRRKHAIPLLLRDCGGGVNGVRLFKGNARASRFIKARERLGIGRFCESFPIGFPKPCPMLTVGRIRPGIGLGGGPFRKAGSLGAGCAAR